MLYRPCNVPFPSSPTAPKPPEQSAPAPNPLQITLEPKIPLDLALPTSQTSPPVLASRKPTKQHIPKSVEPYTLEQQNENLRTLLEQTNSQIIDARVILKQLTSDLVVNNRAGIKQNLLELNRILNNESR